MSDTNKSADKEPDPSFEQALAKLEDIIQQIESGKAPLESLVNHYQTGVKMLKLCREKLSSAEMKIKEVQEIGDDCKEIDFENNL
jgi:exodeoxyribonuclease VII small subunit